MRTRRHSSANSSTRHKSHHESRGSNTPPARKSRSSVSNDRQHNASRRSNTPPTCRARSRVNDNDAGSRHTRDEEGSPASKTAVVSMTKAQIEDKVAERCNARKQSDFKTSDAIEKELRGHNIRVYTGKHCNLEETEWKRDGTDECGEVVYNHDSRRYRTTADLLATVAAREDAEQETTGGGVDRHVTDRQDTARSTTNTTNTTSRQGVAGANTRTNTKETGTTAATAATQWNSLGRGSVWNRQKVPSCPTGADKHTGGTTSNWRHSSAEEGGREKVRGSHDGNRHSKSGKAGFRHASRHTRQSTHDGGSSRQQPHTKRDWDDGQARLESSSQKRQRVDGCEGRPGQLRGSNFPAEGEGVRLAPRPAAVTEHRVPASPWAQSETRNWESPVGDGDLSSKENSS